MRVVRNHVVRLAVVGASIVSVTAACGGDDDTADTATPPAASGASGGAAPTSAAPPTELAPLSVQLQTAPAGSMAFLYKALADGRYADAGIDLEIQPGQSSQGTVEAVAQGTADIGLAGGVAVVLGVANGQEVRSVGHFYGASTFGLFVPGEASEPAEMAAALEGGSVLTIAGGPQNVLFDAFLERLGVDPAAVGRTDVAITSLVQLYAAGEGDGLITVIPFANTVVQAERPSASVLFRDVTGVEPPDSAVVVHNDLLERDPDLVRRFLAVSYAALAEQRDDPEAAVAAILAAEPTLTEDIATGQLLGQLEYLCPAGATGATIGRTAPEQWQGTIDLFETAGLISGLEADRVFTDEMFSGDPVSQATC